MELVRLNLVSRNNKRNGFYIYQPVAKHEGKYYYCECLNVKQPIKVADVKPEQIKQIREIPEQFHTANGIK